MARFGRSVDHLSTTPRRALPWVHQTLTSSYPLERGVTKAYQSKCEIGGKMFLLRAIADDSVDPAVLVTTYRTTKIEKYWGKL